MISWLTAIPEMVKLAYAAMQAAHTIEGAWTYREKYKLFGDALLQVKATKGDTSAMEALFKPSLVKS